VRVNTKFVETQQISIAWNGGVIQHCGEGIRGKKCRGRYLCNVLTVPQMQIETGDIGGNTQPDRTENEG